MPMEGRMPKVVSIVPPSRFDRFKISFPEGWQVVYAPDDREETLLPLVADCDFIFCTSVAALGEAVIKAAPGLRLIHTEGVGYNKVDILAAKNAGVPVCNNRATNNVAVAEHTIGLMLAGLRRTAKIDRQCRKGEFAAAQAAHRAEGSNELAARHVGLYGIGAIGRETARRLKAFGCKVSYFDVFRPSQEQEQELGVSYLDFDSLISSCDIISIHVPVLPNTEKSISYAQFAAMKPNTLLINTARGEIVDQPALIDALENDRIYGAAIDTVAPEPPQDDEPLFAMSKKAMDKLTVTPHIGGTNDEAFVRMLSGAIANMKTVWEGGEPINIVNP